ncbi:MAG: sulfatase [bacterium]
MTGEVDIKNREARPAPGGLLVPLLWTAALAMAFAAWIAIFETAASWSAYLLDPAGGNTVWERLGQAARLLDPEAAREALGGTVCLGALLWIMAAAICLPVGHRLKREPLRALHASVLFMAAGLVLFTGAFHAERVFENALVRNTVFLSGAAIYIVLQVALYSLRSPQKHPLNHVFWQSAWIVAALSVLSSLQESASHMHAFPRYLVYAAAIVFCVAGYYLCRKAGEKVLADAGRRRSFESSGLIATWALIVMAALSGLSFFQPEAKYPELSGRSNRGPNLVFIVLDTVRADRLSLYGHERSTVPFLESLAEEGAVFTRAYTPSPWTLPSHASMFTGLFPSEHNCVHGNLWLDERFETLPEKLENKGYVTLGFSANPWISSFTNMDQGFQVLLHSDALSREEPRSSGQLIARIVKGIAGISSPADSGARQALRVSEDWLKKAARDPRPFFLFINFMEAHLPYPTEAQAYKFFKDPGESAGELDRMDFNWLAYDAGLKELSPSGKKMLRTWYDGSIYYLDRRLEELFRELEKRGLSENTVAVIVSDHGENIGYHGLWGHEFSVYHGLLHVPLLIFGPGRVPKGIEVEKPYSLERLPGLLLSLLDGEKALPLPQEDEDDKLLYSFRNRPYRFMDRVESHFPAYDRSRFNRDQLSVIEFPYHYIRDSKGAHELYRLDRDPHEEENLINELPKLGRKYEKLLTEHAAAHPPRYPESEEPRYDLMTTERLRSLGYIK